jgi:SAM-dependent methyltransferase
MSSWSAPQQFDFALIVLVLEHLPVLDPLVVSLARALRPGARARIIELHPDRVATGSFTQFREGTKHVHFTSVAHSVQDVCASLDTVGFDVVRRDWLATDTMLAAVPGLGPHRGMRLLLDLKLTRRPRDRRGSGAL